MNRTFKLLAGPEAVLAIVTSLIFWICARHGSYSASDVHTLEMLIWQLPFVAVPLTFATILVPGSRRGWWLARANVALLACLIVCAFRIVSGFGAPGSGPKGQDGGFLLILSLGVIFSALANAICGAMILRAQKPGFDGWFRRHPFVAPVLTVAAAAPIFGLQLVATGATVGVIGMFASVFAG